MHKADETQWYEERHNWCEGKKNNKKITSKQLLPAPLANRFSYNAF